MTLTNNCLPVWQHGCKARAKITNAPKITCHLRTLFGIEQLICRRAVEKVGKCLDNVLTYDDCLHTRIWETPAKKLFAGVSLMFCSDLLLRRDKVAQRAPVATEVQCAAYFRKVIFLIVNVVIAKFCECHTVRGSRNVRNDVFHLLR